VNRTAGAKPGLIVAGALMVGAFYQGSLATPSRNDASDGAQISKACAEAMHRMMAGMAIPRSEHVDADFVAMMTAHHQGAVDMAQAEIQFGGNEHLRRIAQEIIIEQQQQIAAMRLALQAVH
jgi:uncharacterized protein (DUF305 family)